jgi:hypothetical protein
VTPWDGTRRLQSVLDSLDYVYLPSRDVAADAERLVETLGARLVFAIEAFDTRVAMLELGESSPPVLLAGHLEGEQAILVYRTTDLERALGKLEVGGVETVARFDIPPGPAAEVKMPGPQRLALYELTRPEVPRRLVGRRDF